MPITITPTQPAGVFTPGGLVHWSSNFIGPLPTGTLVRWSWYADTEETHLIMIQNQPVGVPFGLFTLLDPASERLSIGTDLPAEAASTALRVNLQQPDNVVIDTGIQLAPFSSTIGLGRQTVLQETTDTGGGLTDEQAIQLTETHASTFTDQLVDNLTLIPLASGPGPGPINAFLQDTTFGVIVRLATVPEDLVPQTPDGDYWVKTLAVVRIYRGSDMWKRWPIHTSSKLISFGDDSIVAAVTALTATQWLLNMSMQVTFLPGVTGSVFLMRFP